MNEVVRGRRGGIVLCGGSSARMGADKATLPFRGETLVARAARRLLAAVGEVVVVARAGQALPELPRDVRVVRDEIDGRGPLGGLSPGLRALRSGAAFVTACDAPFVSAAVVDLLFARLGDADAAVVVEDGRVHPLCAVYRRRVAESVERRLGAGLLRATDLLDDLRHVRVDAADLRAVDPDLRTLVDCDTPDAYRAALASADD